MNKQILLTISILISDRPDTVRKCLDSIKPLLESVPSELVLVDTGCGGYVRNIIEEYTDKIVDFEWCKDFSRARNAGLEKAKGKWFLYLDDDEWFDDVTDIIRFFNSGEYQIYGVGLYTQRNYVTMDGLEYSEALVGRMIRLEPDIRFMYRIHECFSRAPGKARKLRAFVHHYGYAHQSEEKTRERSMRNIVLLLEELQEHPGNMRCTLQLAQEYNCTGEREKSLELSLGAIQKAQQGMVEEEYCLSSLYGNAINCYMMLYRYDEAIQNGVQYMKDSRTNKMVRAVIAGCLVIAFVDKEDYAKALYYAGYYWNTYQDYLKRPDAFIEFEISAINLCFHERRRTPVLGNGVRAALHCGETELAWIWFQDMNWQWEIYSLDMSVVRDILELMPKAGEQELAYYEKMCVILSGRPELEGEMIEIIMECCEDCEGQEYSSQEAGERETEQQERMSRMSQIKRSAAYRNIPLEHWFLKLVRLAAAAFLPESGISYGSAEAEVLAGEIWMAMEESMPQMKAYDMPMAVKLLGGDFGHVLETVPFSWWEDKLVWYFSQFTWKDAVWWAERFADVREQDSMYMLAWRAACGISRASGEAAALEREAEKGTYGSVERMLEGLKEYALCRMALCERIYKEEVICTMQDVLPGEYGGAYAIWDLLEGTKEEEYAKAIDIVREIRELLPGLDNIMKQYLKWLEQRLQRQKQETGQAAGEFRILAKQIKVRIQAFMDAGQYQAALSVADQLQSLLPGDEEITCLKEQIKRSARRN